MVTDLHIHSHFSRAVSQEMNLESLYRWGKIKGINVIGSGDFTHPLWLEEIKEKLEPAEAGLFKLKDELSKKIDETLPTTIIGATLRFILTVEISLIYTKNGKTRKAHHLIVAPDLRTVAAINSRLATIGNLKADGRPILGLDSKELVKIVLESNPENLFIPAHIWTPWFSMFGSKSGFDSIAEAFEELAPEIRAIETGLSADPFMNWRLKQLDGVTIISNSDAHSPRNLGREATVINSELNYQEIIEAIKTNDERLVGTIEFYPQEGKYHFDGHRACGIVLSPNESRKLNDICPKCGKPLVLGVDHRVEELSDRPANYRPEKHKKVEYIVPLSEILAQLRGVKSSLNAKVGQQYQQLIAEFGSEFFILRNLEIKAIEDWGDKNLAKAMGRMRKGEIKIKPGYDGVYGIINVVEAMDKTDEGQMTWL